MESPSQDALNQPALPHKLAAILYADVEGYSRLTGADEVGTHRTLSAYLDLFTETIKAHRGEVKHYAGDAVLADFTTVSDAINCAVSFQKTMKDKNDTVALDKRVQFRIGLNLGEVIVDRGEVYGNGVNVAARLETLAEPGGICISGAAHDAIGNKLPLAYDDLGEHSVKNIDKPVRAYRVNLTGEKLTIKQNPAFSGKLTTRKPIAWIAALVAVVAAIGIWQVSTMRTNTTLTASRDPALDLPSGPSIAVLPFTNISGDATQEYFSDGVTEQIIGELARYRGLYVIARNSTFQYKGRAVDVRAVGRELGARYVLEGSVRKSGETIRVSAQLLDAKSGAHVWAETYERALTGANIFALQDDITAKVIANVAGLYGQISRAGLEEAQGKAPAGIDSYECVLRAADWNKVLSLQGQGPVRDCLERAVARDPNYGVAWAWLAMVYATEYEHGYNPRPDMYSALDRALQAGLRAAELDPNNADVHSTLSWVRYLRHELDAASASAERSVALNPNDPGVLCIAGQVIAQGCHKWERGIALAKKAMALSANYPKWCHFPAATYHYIRGEYEQALAESLKVEMPDFWWSYAFLAMSYGQLDREQEAKAAVAKLLELYPNIARNFRSEWRKYNMPETELAVDGLRKAGLDIPPDAK